LKYIFSPPVEAQAETTTRGADSVGQQLPDGFRLGDMRTQDLQLVLDRSPIPRTLTTLKQLVSVGLFHGERETPVGWGFLGKDASISSLHTEAEFRGKGLAVLLTMELLKRKLGCPILTTEIGMGSGHTQMSRSRIYLVDGSWRSWGLCRCGRLHGRR
jgi:hypothetical protein